MLRYRSDAWTLVHVFLAAVASGLALGHSLAWTPLAVLLGMHLIAVEHNHAHLSVFRWKALNLLLDMVLLLLCGIPVLFWRVHHLGSHHRFTWTDRDWSSPFNFRGTEAPHAPVSYRYYQLTYLPLFCCHSVLHIVRSQNPRLVASLVWTAAVLAGGSVALAQAFDPWRWLIVFGTTYLAAGMMLGAANYLEHYSTFEGDGQYSAWTFTCRVHNFLGYNSGYHLLHHRRPEIHWSLLPEVHGQDPSYCPPGLLETGLFPGYRLPTGVGRWLQQHAHL